MKQLFFIFMLMISVFYTRAQADTQTLLDIATVCNYYLDGGTNGDSVLFSKAFHPSGQMMYMRNDTLKVVSLKDFMAGMKNSGVKADRKTKIESIEVHGNAAVATLVVDYPTFQFFDIMSLLKTAEGWKIVGKIFYRHNK